MLGGPIKNDSTRAVPPKYHPEAIVRCANPRGAEKVMYAGSSPTGLSLERIFGERPDVPFRNEIWPRLPRENALRALGLNG